MWIVLSLLCIAPEIDVPATVAPLSRLLPALGQRANMKLIAAVNVRDDVVGIASPKRPIRELMDGIAEAVNATWTEEKGTWVLARTKALIAQDLAKDTAFRAHRLEAALQNVKIEQPFEDAHALALAVRRKELLTMDEDKMSWSGFDELDTKAPVTRFTRQLLERIGVPALASIPYNATTVFSTRPTPRQRKLEIPRLAELYRTFSDEQNRYAKAIASIEGSPEPRSGHSFDFVTSAPPQPSTVLIRVRPQMIGMMQIQVVLADREGLHLFKRNVKVPIPQVENPYQPDRNTPEVRLDADTLALATNRKVWPDDVWARVQQPEKHEPLAPGWRESIAAWSSFRSRPVIALLSDVTLGMMGPPRANMPLAVMQKSLSDLHDIEVSPERAVIRPQQPMFARAVRMDRVAVGKFIRMTRVHGVPTLAATLALMADTDELQEIAAQTFGDRIFRNQLQWDMSGLARLIALAGPEQRSALERTGKLTYGAMNPAQRAWLQKMVFDRRFFNLPAEWTPGVTDRFHDSLQSEPTVAYANGLPNDLTLEVDVEAGEGAITGNPETGWTIATFDEIAGGRIDMGVPMPANVLYRMGQVRRYKAKLSLNSIQGFDFSASDVSDVAAKAVPFDQLDPELRERITARSAALRKQFGIPPL